MVRLRFQSTVQFTAYSKSSLWLLDDRPISTGVLMHTLTTKALEQVQRRTTKFILHGWSIKAHQA